MRPLRQLLILLAIISAFLIITGPDAHAINFDPLIKKTITFTCDKPTRDTNGNLLKSGSLRGIRLYKSIDKITWVKVEGRKDCIFTVDTSSIKSKTYYAVTAVLNDDTESVRSNALIAQIILVIIPVAPSNMVAK